MDVYRSADALREKRERLAATHREQQLRKERIRQQTLPGGFLAFIRYFWHVLEPVDPFVEGWPLECLCAHLEAITQGHFVTVNGVRKSFNRGLFNVPPGFMKSLCTNVFWPAFEWGPMGLPHLRYVAFSYASDLTERDNAKFRDLICSDAYREMWGHTFKVTGDGQVRVKNDKTGFKFASSMGGIGTGERGHRVLCDDIHKLKGTQDTAEARKAITDWVQEGMQNRLNDLSRDAIVVIMQRLHEEDASGIIQRHLGDDYFSLIIPMEYESNRHFSHYIGWNHGQDPREHDGELAWPERFTKEALVSFKRNTYLWSGQYQQNPIPRGFGLIKEDWWQVHEVKPKPNGGYKFIPHGQGRIVVLLLLAVGRIPRSEHRDWRCVGIELLPTICFWFDRVDLPPVLFDQAAAARDRILLILPGPEIRVALKGNEGFLREALWPCQFTIVFTRILSVVPAYVVAEVAIALVLHRDDEREIVVAKMPLNDTGRVFLVQSLHDNDDGVTAEIIEAVLHSLLNPIRYGFPRLGGILRAF